MRGLSGNYLKLYKSISKINNRLYKNSFLIANNVLSKNTHYFADMPYVLTGIPRKQRYQIFKLSINSFIFYAKNLVFVLIHFIINVITKVIMPKNNNINFNNCVLIDTVFYGKNILEEKRFSDSNFRGLQPCLDTLRINYLYTPKWVGTPKLFTYINIFKILNKQGCKYISEFHILTFSDYISAIYFVLFYPPVLFHSINKLNRKEKDLISKSIISDLKRICVNNYIRYLFGKRIATVFPQVKKCIVWYENQARDKNFIRGLRLNKSIQIYGSQSFIYPTSHLHSYPDENEEKFNLLPDVIVVNSKKFIQNINVKTRLGPSFRYDYLFDKIELEKKKDPESIVLLPSYFNESFPYIISIVNDVVSTFGNQFEYIIKLHPGFDVIKNKIWYDPRIQIDKSYNINKVLKSASIIVGTGTSSLIEAAAMGIPVYIIRNDVEFIHHDYIDNNYEPLIEYVETSFELCEKIKYYMKHKKISLSNNIAMAQKIKREYFQETTQRSIINAYDLNDLQ